MLSLSLGALAAVEATIAIAIGITRGGIGLMLQVGIPALILAGLAVLFYYSPN